MEVTVSDSSRDRIEGSIDDMQGRAKSGLGGLTDDKDMQTEGEMDKAQGGLKQGMADAKDKVHEAVKNLTNR